MSGAANMHLRSRGKGIGILLAEDVCELYVLPAWITMYISG
jgi:hypothetical protein